MKSGIYKDWSWHPHRKVEEALRRGDVKALVRRKETREAIIDVHVEARPRPKSKRTLARELKIAVEVRAYVARRNGELWRWGGVQVPMPPASKSGTGPGEDVNADSRKSRPGSNRHEDESRRGSKDREGGGGKPHRLQRNDRVVEYHKGRRERWSREAPSWKKWVAGQIEGACRRRNEGVDSVTWATLVVPNMTETRAHSRHENSAAAIRQAEKEEIKDYIAVDAGTKMTMFSHYELDALLKQFGDIRAGLRHDFKADVVKKYLAQFDPSKHGTDGAAKSGSYGTVADEQPPVKSKKEPKGKGKKVEGAAAVAPKAKGKKLEKKVPKARAKGVSGGDGLGREGTPARFIREAYLKGGATDTIYEAVKKKFPKNEIKSKGYVSWYYHDMKRKGTIK